jgi:hypothetical protein
MRVPKPNDAKPCGNPNKCSGTAHFKYVVPITLEIENADGEFGWLCATCGYVEKHVING